MSPPRIAEGAALLLAGAAGLVVTLVPLGSEVGESTTSTGRVITHEQTFRLVDDTGVGGLVAIVGVPLALTLLPLLTRGPAHRVVTSVTAALLGAATLLALLTVGVLYLPATGALLAAAVLAWTTPTSPSRPTPARPSPPPRRP